MHENNARQGERGPAPLERPPEGPETVGLLQKIGDHLVAALEIVKAARQTSPALPSSSARQVIPWLENLEGLLRAGSASVELEIGFRRALEDAPPPPGTLPPSRSGD